MRVETIGNCTLYHADCNEVLQQLGNVDALVTDPPYGMKFISGSRKKGFEHKKIYNDENDEMLKMCCDMVTGHSAYVFGRWDNLSSIKKPKSVVTWVKNNWGMGDLKGEHARQTECIFFYPGRDHFFPKKRPTDVIVRDRTINALHPTEKPLDLMMAVVEWTHGVVVDPFMGSGSTGVACQKMDRKFVGIEIDGKYFDVACKRIEEARKQPDMFAEALTANKQEAML